MKQKIWNFSELGELHDTSFPYYKKWVEIYNEILHFILILLCCMNSY